jgi:hypothetical protein
MKIPRTSAAAGLFLIAATLMLPAAAAPIDPQVNHRQAVQAHRIAQGVASGELTARETARINAEQRAIRVEERAYKSDGVLTPSERADLNRDLDVASRDIRAQKHDAQRRV